MTGAPWHVCGRAAGGCGPLDVHVDAKDEQLRALAQQYLDLYSLQWPMRTRRVDIELLHSSTRLSVRGDFLDCAHMRVDRYPSTYAAITQYGIASQGMCTAQRDRWTFCIPHGTVLDEPHITEIEDLFSLVCTVGWRADGWLALHAGAVEKDGVCAILCAPSGGGKSTLTAALIRAGWRTLGDDKLLVRADGPRPILRALLQTMNLHPGTRMWFDVGDISALPRYSAWTEKRRVSIDAIAPNAALGRATPTHVISLMRKPGTTGIRARRLQHEQAIPTLLKQVVIPRDRAIAKWTLETITACARQLRGVVLLEIGDDAYADDTWLPAVESVLA
jgi:hypothetical protein